jgi:hypothetical protein
MITIHHFGILLALSMLGIEQPTDVIGEVLGRPIYREHLQPHPNILEYERRQKTPEELEQWLKEDEIHALSGLIFSRLSQAYIDEHNLEATAEEVESIMAVFAYEVDPAEEIEMQRRTVVRYENDVMEATTDEARQIRERLLALTVEELQHMEQMTPEDWKEKERQQSDFQRQFLPNWVIGWKFDRAGMAGMAGMGAGLLPDRQGSQVFRTCTHVFPGSAHMFPGSAHMC